MQVIQLYWSSGYDNLWVTKKSIIPADVYIGYLLQIVQVFKLEHFFNFHVHLISKKP